MESFHTYLKLLIPIFRRGENPDYNNYHPISLISNLSKLMEKIVHLKDFGAIASRLNIHCEKKHGSNYKE